jgi:hypothetical protein
VPAPERMVDQVVLLAVVIAIDFKNERIMDMQMNMMGVASMMNMTTWEF